MGDRGLDRVGERGPNWEKGGKSQMLRGILLDLLSNQEESIGRTPLKFDEGKSV